MKPWPLLLLAVSVLVISGCAQEPSVPENPRRCVSDTDCLCGILQGAGTCSIGNRNYIRPESRCFSVCFGDVTQKLKCIDNECRWVSINPASPGEPVGRLAVGEIGENDTAAAVNVKNTGPVEFVPVVEIDVRRENASVHSDGITCDPLRPGSNQTVSMAVPAREEHGDWTYSVTLSDSNGTVLDRFSKTYRKLRKMGHMYYHLEPHYFTLSNISIWVRNVGDIAFVPIVGMEIYRGEDAVYASSIIYPSLQPNATDKKDFAIPSLQNTTHHFFFVLKERGTEDVMESAKIEIRLGP
jgi:hypothetical protein